MSVEDESSNEVFLDFIGSCIRPHGFVYSEKVNVSDEKVQWEWMYNRHVLAKERDEEEQNENNKQSKKFVVGN
ncbi:hypothetical protein X975_24870, partial [Stegodyphus mimosarum]